MGHKKSIPWEIILPRFSGFAIFINKLVGLILASFQYGECYVPQRFIARQWLLTLLFVQVGAIPLRQCTPATQTVNNQHIGELIHAPVQI